MSDRQELESLLAARGDAIFRYACVLARSRAEAQDLYQEAVVRTLASLHRIPDGITLESYLRRTLYNLNVSWWRRVTRREVRAGDVRPAPLSDGADTRAERDQVWRAILALPVKSRAAIVLKYYEGLADAEIAELLDTSPGGVRSLLSRGRAALRDELTTQEKEAVR